MAEFYTSLSNVEMSSQISDMLNLYNKWYTTFTPFSIMATSARYFVEIEGQKIVGCASHIQSYENLSKIQHVCVLPTHRCKGIAKRLTELAISYCNTEYVYMTIREDNMPSLSLAQALNFRYVTKHRFRDHWTLTFGRRQDNGIR